MSDTQMTKAEAVELLRDLSTKYSAIFTPVKKQAKTLPKKEFIKANLPKIGPVSMMLGKKISVADGKKLLALGWKMIRSNKL